MAKTPKIMIHVISPTEVLFTGSGVAITSLNERGRFDVLPNHTNFISIVNKYIIVHSDKQTRRKFDIKTGVLHCKKNVVSVFIDITGEPVGAPGP